MRLRITVLSASFLGALVSLGCVPQSQLETTSTPSASTNNPTSTPTSTSAPSLVGTWNGSVSAGSGETLQSTFKVASSGNPIYEYVTRNGPRSVELTHVGQRIRFVPEEGGVATVVVDGLSVTSQRITYSLWVTVESTSRSTLSQGGAGIVCEAVLTDGELDLRLTVRSQTTHSQPGIVVPGEEQTVACKGKLKRG